MARIWTALVLVAAALAGLFRAVVRRLLTGPTVPGWGWSMELSRAVLASTIDRAISRVDSGAAFDRMTPAMPMPRSLRDDFEVGPAICGGIAGEWIRSRRHDAAGPVLLYLHGGGYVMGSPAMERPFICSIARASGGGHVFSADYRLAPEHRYPAAVDDAVASYLGMLEGGVHPRTLFVVGDSAGGGLAMALLVSLRDAGCALPAGAVLFSPWVDLSNSAPSFVTNADSDYLPHLAGRAAVEYLGAADPFEPTASPLYADLTGLPPLLILAGGREMILDDATRLADRARRQGVDVRVEVEPDMFHVWPVVVPKHPASRRAIELAGGFIRSRTAA